jgi:CheY-like chemotaxis protein
VLILDDEPMMVRAVQRLLDGDAEIVAITDPIAAIELVRAGQSFDAILCDLMMPRMSGMEVYEAIEKARPELARRMIFMTGGAFTPRAVQFLQTVSNPRVEKPLDRETLRAALRGA